LFTEIVGYTLSAQTGFPNELSEMRDMVPERFKRWADEVRAQALIEFRDQVIAETRAQVLAETLSKQLHRRFGELSPDVADRIQSATSEELDEWLDRVFDAAAISDVFDANRPN
jgi:type VI protein secretion system component VasK